MSSSRITSSITSYPGSSLWGKTNDWKKVIPRISNDNAFVLGQKEIEVEGVAVQYKGELLDGEKATGDG